MKRPVYVTLHRKTLAEEFGNKESVDVPVVDLHSTIGT